MSNHNERTGQNRRTSNLENATVDLLGLILGGVVDMITGGLRTQNPRCYEMYQQTHSCFRLSQKFATVHGDESLRLMVKQGMDTGRLFSSRYIQFTDGRIALILVPAGAYKVFVLWPKSVNGTELNLEMFTDRYTRMTREALTVEPSILEQVINQAYFSQLD